MAGIGFELRKVLRERSLIALTQVFGYSLALSSGPYIITIISLILSYIISYNVLRDASIFVKFHTSVTYLIAFSFIFSGFSQLFFTRYIADRIFERDYFRIMPNTISILLLNIISAFVISFCLSISLFSKKVGYLFSLIYSLTFTILVALWIIYITLVGLKSYKYILLSFIIAYLSFLVLSYFLSNYGINGFIFSFFVGQSVLFLMLFYYLLLHHASNKLIDFDFLNRKKVFLSLIFIGFFYNLGVWTDKFVFWFTPSTSIAVLGPLRYSIIYDVPIFLAYLAIAPGMAIFFLKMEVEFYFFYERYYDAIRNGLSSNKINLYKNELESSARSVILDTARIQGIFNIILILSEQFWFDFFKIPYIYSPLFHILLFGTYIQLLLLCVIAILLYFDRRKEVLIIVLTFFASNLFLSILSIILGPYFYGYGFTLSVLISFILSLILLRRHLNDLHYYTFMFT